MRGHRVSDQRPWRDKVHALAAAEGEEKYADHSYTALSALIEALDAQTDAVKQLDKAMEAHSRTLTYDLKGVRNSL
jgi:hypothetical protein